VLTIKDDRCPVCPAGRLVRFGTRKLHTLALDASGRAVRAHSEAQRWRCKTCSHTFALRPDSFLVRDAVAESAMRRGLAEASTLHGLDVRTVGRMLRDWISVREGELAVDLPDIVGLTALPTGLGVRVVVSSSHENAILDVLDRPDALSAYAASHRSVPSLVAIEVDPVIARAVQSAWPMATLAVPPSAAARAVLTAATISFRSLVRAGVASGRNYREDPRLLSIPDQELTAGDREELSFWSVGLRRLRAAVVLLLRDLSLADLSDFLDSLRRVRCSVANLCPGGSLDALLANWAQPISVGVEHRWLDGAHEAVDALRDEVLRLRPTASFDVLRAILVFSAAEETHFDSAPARERSNVRPLANSIAALQFLSRP
jgi:hypothetical protein